MRKWILLVALLVSQWVQGAASYYTGNDILAFCEGDDLGTLQCNLYIMGVTDASEGKTWDGYLYCKPTSVTGGQLQKIVIKHFNENPADLHLTAHSLVQQALLEAFPCGATLLTQ